MLNVTPNPCPNPNPTPNKKPIHYPTCNSVLSEISSQEQLSPEQMSDHQTTPPPPLFNPIIPLMGYNDRK